MLPGGQAASGGETQAGQRLCTEEAPHACAAVCVPSGGRQAGKQAARSPPANLQTSPQRVLFAGQHEHRFRLSSARHRWGAGCMQLGSGPHPAAPSDRDAPLSSRPLPPCPPRRPACYRAGGPSREGAPVGGDRGGRSAESGGGGAATAGSGAEDGGAAAAAGRCPTPAPARASLAGCAECVAEACACRPSWGHHCAHHHAPSAPPQPVPKHAASQSYALKGFCTTAQPLSGYRQAAYKRGED